jgi:hypothetical protein
MKEVAAPVLASLFGSAPLKEFTTLFWMSQCAVFSFNSKRASVVEKQLTNGSVVINILTVVIFVFCIFSGHFLN